MFGLPIVLHDENSRLLYQYPQEPLGEKLWDMFFDQKTLKSDIMQEYQQKLLSDKPSDFEPFYYRPEDPDESSYILGQVFYKGKNYGFFTVFMFDIPYDPMDIERAKIFSAALSFIMFHRNATSSVSLNALLYDALSNESSEYKRLQAIDTLKRRINDDYILMVKPIGANASQKTYATMAVRQMHDMRKDMAMTIYENCIVILYGNIRSQSYMTTEYKALAEMEASIRSAGKGCGISAQFHHLYNIQNCFQQAYMTALSSDEPVSFYEKAAPSPVFQFVAHYGTAEAFIHPVLNELYLYDRNNKTDYFETLRTYSVLMHNKELAASRLCIHRNTLLYRLNHIGELFHLPYEEPQMVLFLLNSFQLWDIVKK